MIHHVVEPAESFFAAGGDYVGGVWGSFGLFFVALFCSYEHGVHGEMDEEDCCCLHDEM